MVISNLASKNQKSYYLYCMNNPKLNLCFSGLSNRLYQIKIATGPTHVIQKEWTLSALNDEEFWGNDLEDIQTYLYQYREEIQDILQEIPDILNNMKLLVIEIKSTEFPFLVVETVSPEQQKTDILNKWTLELKYYQNELEKYLFEVEKRLVGLGTNRFSNAGFKITLNLTANEIAQFFNLLYENGIIETQDKNGTYLEKQKLANFISKNFNSKRSKNLSPLNIKNAFSDEYSSNLEASIKRLLRAISK